VGGEGRHAEVWDCSGRHLLLSLTCRGEPPGRGEVGEPLAAEAILSDDETLVLVREPPDKGAAVRLWHLRYLHDWNSYREQPVRVPSSSSTITRSRRERWPARRIAPHLRCGGQAHLWNAKDGRPAAIGSPGKTARGAAFLPMKPAIVTWGEGGVKLWDVKTARRQQR